MRLILIIIMSAAQLWAELYFGVGRAIRSQAQTLSAEVGPSREPFLGRPYQNIGDVAVMRGYSATISAPWGAVHNGVDFLVSTGTRREFLAAEEGYITRIEKFPNSITGNWQVNVMIQYNKTFSMVYSFEPFSTNVADADTQVSSLAVREGRKVLKGDLIGKLVAMGYGTHVHFGLMKQKDSAICPAGYFEPGALNAIVASLRAVFPAANLCHE